MADITAEWVIGIEDATGGGIHMDLEEVIIQGRHC